VTRRFVERVDVLIVVEGKNLLERASIEKLRDLVTDLTMIDGARASSRCFRPASRRRQRAAGTAVSGAITQGAEYDQLVQRVMRQRGHSRQAVVGRTAS